MGTITTGIGLISGIDTASLIDSLLAVEAQGKVRLQTRIAELQTQQTALLDINARLLSLKSIAGGFLTNGIFSNTIASSSQPEILSAFSSKSAVPGSYQFIAKQLVSNHQLLSKGFANRDAAQLGLDNLSFEFGRGAVHSDAELSSLNGGAGVRRGIVRIEHDNGTTINTTDVDLGDVTSINEVVERINDSGAGVTASVDGGHIVLDTGAGESFTVSDGVGDFTATDLGIVGASAAAQLVGSDLHLLGGDTPLSILNNGNGILVREHLADIAITTRDGRSFEIDLGGGYPLDILDDTLLADLNLGDGVTISDDEENADFKVVITDGGGGTFAEHDVNLSGVTTIAELKTRVFAETSGDVSIAIAADGKGLTVIDNTGAGGSIAVEGAGENDTDTADDLGILNVTGSPGGYDGSDIPYVEGGGGADTIQDVLDAINNALDTTDADNAGAVTAAISADGLRIEITDTTAGGGTFSIQSTATNPSAVTDLGIETADGGASPVVGKRLIAGLQSVLVGQLNGGEGLKGAVSISVTDRAGAAFSVNDLDAYESLDDLLTHLNDSAGAAQVTFALNAAGNGIRVTDTSGGAGNLTISGDGAIALGVVTDDAVDVAEGSNLQTQYVADSSRLSDLNYGRGVGNGTFRITDATGESAEVTIDASERSVYDVILLINSRGLAIDARINGNGDGIEIVSTAAENESSVPLDITSVSGTAGKDLNLLGTATEVFGTGAAVDGSYEFTMDVAATDTLDDIVEKINDASLPASASIINTGAGSLPFRLSITSEVGGRLGEMVVDTGGVDLGFATISKAQDAKVFFGSDNPSDGFLLTSRTNSLDGVVEGLTLDLLAASDEAVTVTIARDTEGTVAAVQSFVDGLNDVLSRMNEYDFFDVENERRGPLLGNSTVARVRQSLYATLRAEAEDVDSQYTLLSRVGIRVGDGGTIDFDEEQFREAYANDREGVANLFTAFEGGETGQTEEVAPGVTVDADDGAATVRGFGAIFDDLLDALTNVENGVVSSADKVFKSQIDLANERIERIDLRLADRRIRLERQFLAMESALASLQSQGNALQGLNTNVGG